MAQMFSMVHQLKASLHELCFQGPEQLTIAPRLSGRFESKIRLFFKFTNRINGTNVQNSGTKENIGVKTL